MDLLSKPLQQRRCCADPQIGVAPAASGRQARRAAVSGGPAHVLLHHLRHPGSVRSVSAYLCPHILPPAPHHNGAGGKEPSLQTCVGPVWPLPLVKHDAVLHSDVNPHHCRLLTCVFCTQRLPPMGSHARHMLAGSRGWSSASSWATSRTARAAWTTFPRSPCAATSSCTTATAAWCAASHIRP